MKNKSIVTEYEDISAFSGRPATCRHHLLFGQGIRKLAEDDGIWIPLVDDEHNMAPNGNLFNIHGNPTAEKLSKMCGQLAYEKDFYRQLCTTAGNTHDDAREAFLKRYGISYL